MTRRVTTALAAAFLFMAPAAGHADLATYTQDFESMTQADPGALSSDGWLVFVNVFDPGHSYLYGYGPFPAPNNGSGFSGVDAGQGGPEQGAQQLVAYSNYGDAQHGNGNLVESNVFREQTIGAVDVGHVWNFEFDAKLGNLAGATTALAFIKTLDPGNGYVTTNFIVADMTSIPTSWSTHTLSITIDAGLVGQILQIGFANTATNYEGSGVFYDNLSFTVEGVTPAKSRSWGSVKLLYR